MIELENHHFVTPSVISDSGNNRQWMLKTLEERSLGNRLFTWSQSMAP